MGRHLQREREGGYTGGEGERGGGRGRGERGKEEGEGEGGRVVRSCSCMWVVGNASSTEEGVYGREVEGVLVVSWHAGGGRWAIVCGDASVTPR